MAGVCTPPEAGSCRDLPHQCPWDLSQSIAAIVKVSTRAPGVLCAQPRGTSPLPQPWHVARLSPGRALPGAKFSLARLAPGPTQHPRCRQLVRMEAAEASDPLVEVFGLSGPQDHPRVLGICDVAASPNPLPPPPPFHLVGSLSPFCPAGFNPIQLPQPKLRSTSFGGRSSHMCLLCVVFRQDLSLSPHSLT